MAALNPANRVPSGLVPYYRRYDLPWAPSEETERRFRVILRNLAIVFAIIAGIMPFLPRTERVNNTDSLPERVVQLVMEPPPPPPPPPPRRKEKPVEKAPVQKVPTPPQPVDPRAKASKSGLLANLDDLAALRDQIDLDKFQKNQQKTTDPGDVTQVTRSIISSKAGGTSGGINSPTSSGLASGSGSLRGIYTTQVKDPNLGASGQAATRAGGSGKASRSADEIALVFTKNKGAIELTIAPSGDITAARVVSSELHDPVFEEKLVSRIKLFKFDAKDVAALTATKPIDFFPAG